MLEVGQTIEVKVKVIFVLGFISAFISYSFFDILGPYIDGVFYKGLAISFCCYTYCFWQVVKDKWFYIPLIIFNTCLNKMYDEFFGDPKAIELQDYILFIVSTIVTLNYKRIDKYLNKIK